MMIFVFLIPEVISSNEPGADERKKTMVKGFCAVRSPLHAPHARARRSNLTAAVRRQRLKAAIQLWDCDKFGPGSPIEAMVGHFPTIVYDCCRLDTASPAHFSHSGSLGDGVRHAKR